MKQLLAIGCCVLCFGWLAFGASGCGSACEDLASRICGCQPTRTKERFCRNTVNSAKENLDISSSAEDACQAILDSGKCTCEALQAGDLAACGLANSALADDAGQE